MYRNTSWATCVQVPKGVTCGGVSLKGQARERDPDCGGQWHSFPPIQHLNINSQPLSVGDPIACICMYVSVQSRRDTVSQHPNIYMYINGLYWLAALNCNLLYCLYLTVFNVLARTLYFLCFNCFPFWNAIDCVDVWNECSEQVLL